ncbi:hypothetical protein [Methanocella conradii]|uniref:hypothetical protein n=1 Tax=Methanocella conradii TaxID=1175444 RepID=UPI00157C706A|nr:hypothetical protein [Methanocella conradii]
MDEEYNEYELKVLQKVCLKGRFCPHKHMSIDQIINGLVPSHLFGKCEDAIYNLIKKGFLSKYKSGNRVDVCFNKGRYREALEILASYKEKYSFINVDRLVLNMAPHDKE